jgi:hypothetical protein
MRSKPKTVEDKKCELLDGLVAARSSVLAAVQALPPACLDQPFLGEWSVKDLLAHLVGWDFTNLQAVREILSGQYPSFFQYYDKDWHTYNQRLVSQYRREPLSALLAELEDSHGQLLSFLRALPAADLLNAKARHPTGRTVTLRNLLLSEADDERIHAQQVIAFREQKKITPPPHAAF